ncbi:MAG TPA: hypothetical protein VEO54_21090 [Thermoanaerobaculia bacterium]|nr:hypothetical protein [Thermoanaerobaculia bacterium]
MHHDSAVSAAIAERALAGLDAAADAQRKRLYYARAAGPKQLKTFFPRDALLQFLVFSESEPFERSDEGRGGATQAAVATRYVKHLVSVSARRNSFHAALALCRLLFGYSTAETMEIYGALLHERDYVKEDYYYRARKRLLMREIEQRFSGVTRTRGPRSEERFAATHDQRPWREVVLAALTACTPWGSGCVDPRTLNGRGDAEHPEVDRLHALIHPPCFRALTAHAGVAPPELRWAVPTIRATGVPQAIGSESATVSAERVATMERL